MQEISPEQMQKIKQDYVNAAAAQIENVLQVHAWKCTKCGTPFLTTYRKYEVVRTCPYCDSTEIMHDMNMRGPRAVVIW